MGEIVVAALLVVVIVVAVRISMWARANPARSETCEWCHDPTSGEQFCSTECDDAHRQAFQP